MTTPAPPLSKAATKRVREDAHAALMRLKIQAFQKRVPGRFTVAEWSELSCLALEWAGFHTMVFHQDGSTGVLHAPPKLMMVLDALGNMAVEPRGEHETHTD